MKKSPSLTGRALLAIGLFFGFYILALAIVIGLLSVPVLEYLAADRVHLRLAIPMVIAAIAVAWSLRPRRDRFEPTNPKLTEQEHPALHAEIGRVGQKLAQKLPGEVYLDSDVNAAVTQRGGVMGFGSRRVMFVGLPLLAGLSTAQFRSVLAHEFGHFHGGDTMLGPWIYATRAAIGRSIYDLRDRSALQWIFIAYAKLFLMVTHAISRSQELAADALSATHYGREVAQESLRSLITLEVAWQSYWTNHVAPALEAGFRPPLMDGYLSYLRHPVTSKSLGSYAENLLEQQVQGKYDTHPPIRERIAALAAAPAGPSTAETEPALSLVKNVDQLEQQVLVYAYGEKTKRLQPVTWEEVAAAVHLPVHEGVATRHAEALAGMKLSDVPDVLRDPAVFIEKIRKAARDPLAGTRGTQRVSEVLTAAIITTLVRNGWTLTALPGEPPMLKKGTDRLLPTIAVDKVGADMEAAENWRKGMADLGISELDLGAVTRAQALV